MGGARTKRVEVTVQGESYPLRTPATVAAERRVNEAARLLSERMERIAEATRELSSHRLAVMAALDLATELLVERESHECTRADEAAFRRAIRQRSDRLLSLVRDELADRRGGKTPS